MEMTLALDYVETVLEYDTPIRGYRLKRLVCATQKLVNGVLYALDVQVADENGKDRQYCSIKILEPSLVSRKTDVQIACDGQSPWSTFSRDKKVITLDLI